MVPYDLKQSSGTSRASQILGTERLPVCPSTQLWSTATGELVTDTTTAVVRCVSYHPSHKPSLSKGRYFPWRNIFRDTRKAPSAPSQDSLKSEKTKIQRILPIIHLPFHWTPATLLVCAGWVQVSAETAE